MTTRDHAIRLIHEAKVEACDACRGQVVEIDDVAIARISVQFVRDRDTEGLCGEAWIFVPVAYVHLTKAGFDLVGRGWNGSVATKA